MTLLVWLIGTAVFIYSLVIVVYVIMSWLVALEMVNASNEHAKNLTELLRQLTDPVFKPIRKFIPPIGGIDLTPLIVIVGLHLLQQLLITLLFSF